MNDILRRKMATALAFLRGVGIDTTGWRSRNSEFEIDLPWNKDASKFFAWTSMCPLMISPDGKAVAFAQGKGHVFVFKRSRDEREVLRY